MMQLTPNVRAYLGLDDPEVSEPQPSYLAPPSPPEYDPRQYDEGPREAMPTSTYNDPTSGGTVNAPINYPSSTATSVEQPGNGPTSGFPSSKEPPSYTLQDGRTTPPTPSGQWEPVTNLTQPQRPPAADPGQWLAEDSQSQAPARTAEDMPPRSPYDPEQAASMEPRADRFDAAPAYGQVAASAGEPDYVDSRPRTVTEQVTRAVRDQRGPGGMLEPAGGLARIVGRMNEIGRMAEQDTGRQLGMVAVRDPSWRAANPELAAEYEDLQRQFDLGMLGNMDAPKRVASAAAQVAAPVIRETVEAAGRGVRGVVDDAVQGASRLVREGQEAVARNVPAGETQLGSGFVPINGYDPIADMRGNIVPPTVGDRLDFPLRVPSDPGTIQAIEASGGTVDRRGVTIPQMRGQGEDVAGLTALRDGTFYEPAPPGARSTYHTNEPSATGGNTLVGPKPTRYRAPLIVEHGSEWNMTPAPAVLTRLGVVQDIETFADELMDAINQAGSRRQPLVDVVEKYGGDPRVVSDVLALHGDDVDSVWMTLAENIAARNARKAGHDGVIVLTGSKDGRQAIEQIFDLREGRNPSPRGEYWLHPDVRTRTRQKPSVVGASESTAKVDAAEQQRRANEWLNSQPEFQQAVARVEEARRAFEPFRYGRQNTVRTRYEEAEQAAYAELRDVRTRLLQSRESVGSGLVPTMSDARNAAQGAFLGAAQPELMDENVTPEDRLQRAGIGAVAGLTAGRMARGRGARVPRAGSGMVPEQPGGFSFEDFARAADSPEQRAAREAASQPPARANNDRALREQFGRPWEEVAPALPSSADQLGEATRQIVTEGQGFQGRAGRNRVFPDEQANISGPVRIEPQSLNMNATPGFSPSAGLVNDLGNSVGGGVAGAAAGGAMPADSEEQRRQNMLTGAGLGMVGGPIAGRLMPRSGGALATPGVSPTGPRRRLRSQAIQATDTAEVSRLRLDKFPEEVRDLIEAGAREQDWARTQRRGVMSDEAVQQMADDDVVAVDALIKRGKAGRAYNAEETVALRNAVASQAQTVRQLSDEIADARANGMTPDLLIARRAAESARLQGLVKVAEGARAEAGRALRQYRQQARLIELNPDQAIQQIYRRLGGKENAEAAVDEYTKLVQDGANPIQLAKFWSKVEAGEITGADLFALYRRFNMLSGPRTIEVNALSGAINLGYEVTAQAISRLGQGRLREAAAEIAAPFKAMGRAFQNMAETARYGVSEEQALRGDIPRTLSSRTDNKAAKAALTVMELPDRFNAAVDQFYRTMTEDWAATTLAQRQARDAGIGPRSKNWAETVAQNLEAIRDDPSKFPEIKKMADHVTFSEEPGALGKGLEQLRRQSPLVMNAIAPFIRTPYNIASRAVDMAPLGIVRTAAEVATGAGRGRQNVSQRVRDNLIGTAGAVWAYNAAQNGDVTGKGPDDPEKRAMLQATGWQPYSVKIGDTYWSYANVAPFNLMLASGAAAYEAQKYAKDGKTDTLSMLADGAERTASVVTDMTVLAGIGAVVKSIQDPDRYGGQWLTQFLQTLIPAGSALNTVGQMQDPNIRRAERDTFGNQVQQGVASRLPDFLSPVSPIGTRKDVPVAQTPLGEPVPNNQTGAAALIPVRPSPERPDPAMQAFIDAGVDIGKPKENLSLRPGAPQIPLSPAEQRRWNELRGEQLQQVAPQVAKATSYQQAGKSGQELVLKRLLNNASSAADAKLIGEIGQEEIRRRLTEAAKKKAG